jgi:hypothetical protein
LEIFFDAFGFAHQVGDVLVGRFGEASQHLHLLLEIFQKLFMFLIAPRAAQTGELALDHGHLIQQSAGELLELMGETANFARVDDCLGHKSLVEDEESFFIRGFGQRGCTTHRVGAPSDWRPRKAAAVPVGRTPQFIITNRADCGE